MGAEDTRGHGIEPIEMTLLRAAPVCLVALLAIDRPSAQEVKLEELLDRAGVYIQQFVGRFSNVVAEEHYKQQRTAPHQQRILRSDFMLVKFPGVTDWYTFRDVVEVDGKPVGGRDERLVKLFVDPPTDIFRRAREISDAGSRHNLPGMGSVNNPLLALAILQADYRDRFHFNLAGLDKGRGPDVRMVRFNEFRSPTIVRGNANRDIFSTGLFWIEQGTGRVVQTELRLGVRQSTQTRIVTRFAPDPDLDVNVPVEMSEWYPDGLAEIRGVATYGKFRRFTVQTEETIK